MNFFYMEELVDALFAIKKTDSEEAANKFLNALQKGYSDVMFEQLLITSGFIPDLYENDSSQETLYTKLVEALVSEWARRIGARGDLIKEKSSREDIRISIDGRIIVSDAKSFRLGRSQQAPNAKDFLKLEDIRKWMERYDSAIGGLVTYPCKHEWTVSSDIYQYCSTKDAPTLMLPYKYLALILHYKNRFSASDLLALWDYNRLFPAKLPKSMVGGNKKAYWKVINAELFRILHITKAEFEQYMFEADRLIDQCVQANIRRIDYQRKSIIEAIRKEVSAETDIEKLKAEIIEYKISAETELYDKILHRIKSFRC